MPVSLTRRGIRIWNCPVAIWRRPDVLGCRLLSVVLPYGKRFRARRDGPPPAPTASHGDLLISSKWTSKARRTACSVRIMSGSSGRCDRARDPSEYDRSPTSPVPPASPGLERLHRREPASATRGSRRMRELQDARGAHAWMPVLPSNWHHVRESHGTDRRRLLRPGPLVCGVSSARSVRSWGQWPPRPPAAGPDGGRSNASPLSTTSLSTATSPATGAITPRHSSQEVRLARAVQG
jgi:hypothetical protein